MNAPYVRCTEAQLAAFARNPWRYAVVNNTAVRIDNLDTLLDGNGIPEYWVRLQPLPAIHSTGLLADQDGVEAVEQVYLRSVGLPS